MAVAVFVVPMVGFIPDLNPNIRLVFKMIGNVLHFKFVLGIKTLSGRIETSEKGLFASLIHPAEWAQNGNLLVAPVFINDVLQGMQPSAIGSLNGIPCNGLLPEVADEFSDNFR